MNGLTAGRTWKAMAQAEGAGMIALKMAVLHLLLPALLSLAFSEIMRSRGWIKPGDMLLKL